MALNELGRKYWRPIYTFVRSRGYCLHDAEDLTQAYFEGFFERRYLGHANPTKGRFRAFLLHDLKFFLSNERGKADAAKRGAKVFFVPMDTSEVESRLDTCDLADSNADAYFDREWALEMVRHARNELAGNFLEQGKAALFNVLQRGLTEIPTEEIYQEWSRDLGMSSGALKVALHRLRNSFRKALESQVRETVDTEEDVRAEMKHLRGALSQSHRELGD
ncbi:sigma-70 family RNA polymerase sigma factor [Prosthecobacter debontii]|uniref:sigma-70 family RNA polymerase sigma factor n=1 Tax=Prosthecobacter debontii TaxID=48467 RepID=UPI0011161446|nr:sigma-70 family RNA polymerase sigma factor [Prosthecobacter debontii]